jgi:NitT/TauT family transport system substrate-binding protein
VLPEPFVTRVLHQNPELGIVADLQELFTVHADVGMPQTVLAVRPGGNATDQLANLLRASVDAVIADPERTGRLVAKLGLGLDEDTVVDSLPRLNLRVESASQSRDALTRYFSILYAFEPAAVGGQMPPSQFYGE